MPRFVGSDLRFMLQSETDVVEPIQQAMSDEFIDGKLRAESGVVSHLALFQVNRDVVVVNLAGSAHQFSNFSFGQLDRKKSILRAVVGKDVGKGRRDYSA